MESPSSPQQEAYNRHSSRTLDGRQEARIDQPVANADRSGQLSPVEADLHRRLSAMEGWKANLQGENGISVNDNVISVDARSLRPISAGSSAPGATPIWIIEGGVAVQYLFAATLVAT